MIEKALWFRSICLQNGVEVDSTAAGLLSEYVTLLLSWNKKINLISRKDEENVWENHILHCASLSLKVDFPRSAKIIDIGTGGGLPGIVLKILRPDLSFLLIDSTKKKIEAVQAMITALQLKNISAEWGRAEELSKSSDMQNAFDFVTARAVAELPQLVKWGLPFLVKRGEKQKNEQEESSKISPRAPAFVVLKGGDLSKEIKNTHQRYPNATIREMELSFAGAEILQASQKKIVYVQF